MRAVVYIKYGSPDVLNAKRFFVPKPAPREDEILVKVYADNRNHRGHDHAKPQDSYTWAGKRSSLEYTWVFESQKDPYWGWSFRGN